MNQQANQISLFTLSQDIYDWIEAVQRIDWRGIKTLAEQRVFYDEVKVYLEGKIFRLVREIDRRCECKICGESILKRTSRVTIHTNNPILQPARLQLANLEETCGRMCRYWHRLQRSDLAWVVQQLHSIEKAYTEANSQINCESVGMG